MFVAWSPIYAHPLPEGHRFPMIKYELLPQQLLREGIIEVTDIHQPDELAESDILLTHDKDYWYRLKNLELSRQEIRRTGFPLSEELVRREVTIAQGTVDGTLHALQNGIAFNIAGGTHHAFTNRGEGFCLLNDQAIAASYLLHHKLAKKILIIDLDVHQGNGTAEIFANTPEVFTFSMHGAKNYPCQKEMSDLDIPLPDGTGDEEYLLKLRETLPRLIDQVRPDFAFYLSGVDVLSSDKLGRLALSVEGCKERDRVVFSLLHKLQIPVQVSMGGAYSPDIKVIVNAHANTYKVARDMYR